MVSQFDLVQAAYEKWMETLAQYRTEIQRVTRGGVLDVELLRTLSDNTKRDSAAFSDAVNARATNDKKD